MVKPYIILVFPSNVNLDLIYTDGHLIHGELVCLANEIKLNDRYLFDFLDNQNRLLSQLIDNKILHDVYIIKNDRNYFSKLKDIVKSYGF